MSNREFFAERVAYELPGFLKVIRALPPDRLDYRPHERNTSAGALAWQIATEMSSLPEVIETGVLDFEMPPAPATVEEIAAHLEKGAQRTIEAARAAADDRWSGPAKMLWGGNVAWEDTVSNMAWGFLFDMVHHRGQLTAYLRPMGGKVPAVYGPSGDDKG